ncbi:MAG: helix-turn-helix transcriptional regulator [Candidatus Dormibacteraceae bacterium]
MPHKTSQPQPNPSLRSARLEQGWTQEEVLNRLCELAETEGYPELKMESGIVCRWERGKQWPSAHHIFLLGKLYNKSARQLGLEKSIKSNAPTYVHASPFEPATLVSMKRRSLMANSITGAALTLASPFDLNQWERISHIFSTSKAPDDAIVSALETETIALRDLEPTIPSAQLFPYFATHLSRLADVLNRTVTPELRQRLIMTTGIAADIGGWVAWDKGDFASSQRLYRTASDASHEAHYPLSGPAVWVA